MIKELAEQIKRTDSRIVYAHPELGARGHAAGGARARLCPPARTALSAPADTQTASVAATKETKRVAKQGKAGKKKYAARKHRRGKLVAQRTHHRGHEAVWTHAGHRTFRLSAWGGGGR